MKLVSTCRALLCALLMAGLLPGYADIFPTNRPFAGVVHFSEARTNPPTRLFVAEVDLKNPTVQLRVARGGEDPDGAGPWQTTLMQPTKIAAREGFALVVNGDFFKVSGVRGVEGTNSGYRAQQWSLVEGAAMTDGVAWSASSTARPCLVVHNDRSVRLEMLTQPGPDTREVVAGNTMLLKDGRALPHSNKDRHPRTAVGLNADGTRMVLLVVDGRKSGVAIGMNYDELAAEMLRLGCHDAMNLDGGGSSVMAIREPGSDTFQILNQPTDGRERAVANVLGVLISNSAEPNAAIRN